LTSALQAIVFDFDGVIADSEPLHLRAYQQALDEEGVKLTREQYFTRYLGYDDVGMLEAVARDRSLAWSARHITALVARKGEKLQEMLKGDDVLFAGAAEFVRAAATEVPIGIASGALRHEIVQIIDGAGLGSLFATIVSSGDTPESKPSPGPYLLAFEQLQRTSGRKLDPAKVVAIEDSRWGLESARGAGLRCVGDTTSYPAAELTAAELVVDSLKALTIEMLDRLVIRDV
jgi:beta-phosphoglucomutase